MVSRTRECVSPVCLTLLPRPTPTRLEPWYHCKTHYNILNQNLALNKTISILTWTEGWGSPSTSQLMTTLLPGPEWIFSSVTLISGGSADSRVRGENGSQL